MEAVQWTEEATRQMEERRLKAWLARRVSARGGGLLTARVPELPLRLSSGWISRCFIQRLEIARR